MTRVQPKATPNWCLQVKADEPALPADTGDGGPRFRSEGSALESERKQGRNWTF